MLFERFAYPKVSSHTPPQLYKYDSKLAIPALNVIIDEVKQTLSNPSSRPDITLPTKMWPITTTVRVMNAITAIALAVSTQSLNGTA